MPMYLRVQRGANAGAVFPLRPGAHTIGRSAENRIVLPDDKVSAAHARIDVDSTSCMLTDLDSTNGTAVNDAAVRRPTRLRAGDVVQIGNATLVYGEGEIGDEPPTTGVHVVVDDAHPQRPIAWSPEETTQLLPPTAQGIEAGELRRLYGILSALYRVTSVVSRSTTLAELLAHVLDVVFDIVPADHGSVVAVGSRGGPLQPVVGRCRTARDQTIRVSETIVRDVARSRRGVLTRDATADERFRGGHSVQLYGIRSALCVPIRTPRQFFGVLYLDTRSVERELTERDLELLNAVGSEVGLAVENFQLYQEKLEAERLAAIGQAVAGLSHYIRNILQSMEAARFLIPTAIEEDDPAELAESWAALDRNIELISELALNMLSYSKEAEPRCEPCEPNAIAAEAVDMVAPRAEEAGTTVDFRPDEAMPPARLDRGAVRRALLNLVTNAVDAAGQGTVRVATRWEPAARRVEFRVVDDGPGIPPELHETIFEAFFTTKGSSGTGLGLAVSRKLIEDLGGRIHVHSAPGQGATFVISLPLEPGAHDED